MVSLSLPGFTSRVRKTREDRNSSPPASTATATTPRWVATTSPTTPRGIGRTPAAATPTRGVAAGRNVPSPAERHGRPTVNYPPRNADDPGGILYLARASSGRMATLAAHATEDPPGDDHRRSVIGDRPRILTEAPMYVRPMAGYHSRGRTAQRGPNDHLIVAPDIHPHGCILEATKKQIVGLLPEPTTQINWLVGAPITNDGEARVPRPLHSSGRIPRLTTPLASVADDHRMINV